MVFMTCSASSIDPDYTDTSRTLVFMHLWSGWSPTRM